MWISSLRWRRCFPQRSVEPEQPCGGTVNTSLDPIEEDAQVADVRQLSNQSLCRQHPQAAQENCGPARAMTCRLQEEIADIRRLSNSVQKVALSSLSLTCCTMQCLMFLIVIPPSILLVLMVPQLLSKIFWLGERQFVHLHLVQLRRDPSAARKHKSWPASASLGIRSVNTWGFVRQQGLVL